MTSFPDLANPRLLAVLYADIHGYSGLVEKDPVRTIARLANALNLIRNLVGDYGGAVVNTAGDGLVAVFESPAQAVRFALQMQRELAREVSWAEGARPLLYRIGIALGIPLPATMASMATRSTSPRGCRPLPNRAGSA